MIPFRLTLALAAIVTPFVLGVMHYREASAPHPVVSILMIALACANLTWIAMPAARARVAPAANCTVVAVILATCLAIVQVLNPIGPLAYAFGCLIVLLANVPLTVSAAGTILAGARGRTSVS